MPQSRTCSREFLIKLQLKTSFIKKNVEAAKPKSVKDVIKKLNSFRKLRIIYNSISCTVKDGILSKHLFQQRQQLGG